jgi:ribosomal protein S18 acetylase RimI-like enzyme
MIEIKNLSADKWRDFKELRLEALQNDPLAFGSSYQEEIAFPEEEWKRRISNTLFAILNDKPVGMIVYIINTKIKSRHIAEIFGVYVKNEFRNQKVGKKLVENALKLIQQNRNVTKVKLIVSSSQNAAIILYESFGFEIVGKLKNELKVDNDYYDGLIMEKFL